MRPAKISRSASPPQVKSGGWSSWQILLWLVFAANSLFFLPQCLDRSLAPRFFFLSLTLLVGVFLVWKYLREKADWRLHSFDLLLLGWYGLNLASIGWAFSWSEAVFYTQKVLLLFLTYWLVRQALVHDEDKTHQTLRRATTLLTFAVCGILLAQLAMAAMQHGLDNQKLYNLDWFIFGNKSLTTEFLFFLLVFNVLFYEMPPSSEGVTGSRPLTTSMPWLSVALLLALILLLQTRTVYLALAAGSAIYFPVRALSEPAFARIFKKKILPAGVIALGLLAGFLAFKGAGNSLAERLNPLTYLESATANERRFVWYKTDLLNADHFWLGVGNGSWKLWFPSKNIEGGYRLQEQNVVFTRAHNDYLEVRSEMGIVGVALFCALFGAAFLAAIWALRRPDTEPRVRRDLLALTVGLLGYCNIQYFDFPRERIEMQAVLAVLFAYTAFHTRELWARLPGVFIGKFKFAFLGLAIVGLLFNLVVGWNRVWGEIHNVRMMNEQAKRDYPRMITEARAAENRFYEYNEVAVPLVWYEGVAFYQMNQPDKAVGAFERAYRLNPWSFQVINNYASALVKSKRFSEAIPLYEKVVEINPRYEDGKFNLAYTYYQAGDTPKALDWLDRMDTIPNPKTDEERRKNASVRQRQTDFRKTIEAGKK
jgi:O-antigen ligase